MRIRGRVYGRRERQFKILLSFDDDFTDMAFFSFFFFCVVFLRMRLMGGVCDYWRTRCVFVFTITSKLSSAVCSDGMIFSTAYMMKKTNIVAGYFALVSVFTQ